MSRDYANRKNRRSLRPQHRKTSKAKPLLRYLILLGVGCWIGWQLTINRGRLSWQFLPFLAKPAAIKPISPTPKPSSSKHPASSSTAPQWEFHPLPTQPSAPQSQPEHLYELETKSLKDFATADQLKAQLTLQGFTASIVPHHHQGVTQYRIQIGPYSDRNQALADQKRLKRDQVFTQLTNHRSK